MGVKIWWLLSCLNDFALVPEDRRVVQGDLIDRLVLGSVRVLACIAGFRYSEYRRALKILVKGFKGLNFAFDLQSLLLMMLCKLLCEFLVNDSVY